MTNLLWLKESECKNSGLAGNVVKKSSNQKISAMAKKLKVLGDIE